MAGKGLYGHPEIDVERGIGFASGRLGHIWPFANGIAMAHPHLSVVVLGSDGAQMEGNDPEAAGLAAARKLNVKLLIDDNNVTIAGQPSAYLPGFSVEATLAGHGLAVNSGQAEEFRDLYARVQNALIQPGPFGVVNRRRSEEHTSELQSRGHLVCRLLLEKKKTKQGHHLRWNTDALV